MSYPADLIDQARVLAGHGTKKPRQADLRRAVSAAYYALFHLLTEAGAKQVAGRSAARTIVRRAFVHGTMREVCEQVSRTKMPKPWRDQVRSSLPPELIAVASAFIELQEARHEADYNFAPTFYRRSVYDLIDQAERAIEDWKKLRKVHPDMAELFLLALLLGSRVRR